MHRNILFVTLCLLGAPLSVFSQTPTKAAKDSQTYTQDGIAVSFSVERTGQDPKSELKAGTAATVRFSISDTNSGQPLSSLRPSAWIDRRDNGQQTSPRQCREKIQSFLQPGFNRRPSADLNAYLILALNNEPNISVIDPLSGFGGSKLYTLVSLLSPGEDWVMTSDKKRLYVSMPAVNKVAIIDTDSWKLISTIEAGVKPTRVALQNDNRYLWVSIEDAETSGFAVVDTLTSKVAAIIKTGSGPHEIEFTQNDTAALVTNKTAGTLSIIDIPKLQLVKTIPIGSLPVSVAFSSLSKTIYVANEGDGNIVVVDASNFEIVKRIIMKPGLRTIRIEPFNRFGFAVNSANNSVYIFDIASNQLSHTVAVGPAPDQITFTRQFAYIRSAGNEFVNMIKLSDLGKEAALTRFPAGEKPPKDSNARSLANAIVPAPEDGAILVANPADKMIYYYTEGMAAPMGSFQNYRRDPKALLVVDNSLVETAPGVYSTGVRLTQPGNYDVAFLVDSPRVVNCFNLKVVDNPNLPKPTELTLRIEPLWSETAMARTGKPMSLRFKATVSGSETGTSKLEDIGVLVFLAPGIWQHREVARPLDNGTYETSFTPPQTGIYYVYFQCPSLGIRFNQTRPLTIQATPEGATTSN